MNYQLKIGKKIEREHLGTYKKLKAYHSKNKRCISDEKFTEAIARDHLKEDKNYYTKLKKAGL
jgi:hypothetical protein